MREAAHATRETVARAPRVVRYLARKPHLVWTLLVEKTPQVLNVLTDSNWASHDTERWSSLEALFSKRLQRLSADARLHRGQAACGIQLQFVCRDRLPGAAPSTHRLERCTWYDDETWIWPCEASENQNTLVSGNDRAKALRTGHNEPKPADIGTKTPRADRTVHLLRAPGNGLGATSAG